MHNLYILELHVTETSFFTSISGCESSVSVTVTTHPVEWIQPLFLISCLSKWLNSQCKRGGLIKNELPKNLSKGVNYSV